MPRNAQALDSVDCQKKESLISVATNVLAVNLMHDLPRRLLNGSLFGSSPAINPAQNLAILQHKKSAART